MFGTSLRKIPIIFGLILMLTASLGAVVSAAPAAALADEDGGALIVSVRANSPADKAGLVRGDIVLAVDGEATDGAEALATAIVAHETGDEVVLTVLHGSETVELPVILGERNGRTYLGVQPYVEASMAAPQDEGADEQAPAEADPDKNAEEKADEKAPAEAEGEDAEGEAEEGSDEGSDEGAESKATEPNHSDLLPMDGYGAIVAKVVSDGPAAAAGLEKGDFIVAVDGEPLSPEADLATLIGAYAPGDEVTLEVRSAAAEEGESAEVVVTLGAHPDDETKAFLGVSYMEAPFMPGSFRGMPFAPHSLPGTTPDQDGEEAEKAPAEADEDKDADSEAEEGADEGAEGKATEPNHGDLLPMDGYGAIVAEVLADSPAAVAGLETGDFIVAVDGEPLSPEADLATLIGAYAPGDEVTLEVRSAAAKEGENAEVVVTLGAHPDDETKAFLGVSYMEAPFMPGSFRGMPFAPHSLPDTTPDQSGQGDEEHGSAEQPEGDSDGCNCDHDHEEHHQQHREQHHGYRGHDGMMAPIMPFLFGHGMEDLKNFDLDQLSEEDRQMLEEMMPFLFPDVQDAPESESGL